MFSWNSLQLWTHQDCNIGRVVRALANLCVIHRARSKTESENRIRGYGNIDLTGYYARPYAVLHSGRVGTQQTLRLMIHCTDQLGMATWIIEDSSFMGRW